MQSLIKQPAEELRRAVPFDTTAAIASITSVAAAKRNLVAGSANLILAGALTAGMLFVTFSGGTDGEHYLITARVADADGQDLEAELEVAVIDGTWTMPDGGDGYLSIAQFVGLVGLEETVRLTDTAGNGRIDRALLINALAAEQSLADAWLGRRYTVPLAAPAPAIVKTAIGDKARVRLYSQGAPENLVTAAKEAQKLLEQIGAGKLPLPGLAAPAEAPSAAPIAVSPGTRRYPDGLAEY